MDSEIKIFIIYGGDSMKRLFGLFLLIIYLGTTSSMDNNIPNSNQYDKEGKRDGLWVYKYSETLVQYTYYSHGIQHGTVRGYNPSTSQLLFIGDMKNGAMIGTWVWFDDNNNILWKCYDFKDTATLIPDVHHYAIKYAPHNCYCVDYYGNGRIKSEGRWFFFTSPDMDDTGEYGTWKYYDEEGNLTKTIIYK